MPDLRISRPGGQVVFKFLDRFFVSFGKGLDAAILEIFYIPANLMPSRRALGEKPVTYALNYAANDKSSRNDHIRKFRA